MPDYKRSRYLCLMDAGVNIKFYKPCEALKPYVRYYYTLQCGIHASVLTFPLGSPQIIFHRKNPLFIPQLDSFQPEFTISGQVNFPANVVSSGNTDMLVAVFYPHTLSQFIATPLSAFYNREISGYDLGNKALNLLAAHIFECKDILSSISIIERFLLSRLAGYGNRTERLGAAIKAILTNPSVPVSYLSSISCIGKKQFERIFRANIGMNPKEYAVIARFQKSLWLMQQGKRNFADIAYIAGYSDQSHFNRDFRKYSGMTPSRLLNTQPIYSDLYSSPV